VGFKKRNKGVALISFLLIIGAYGFAEMSKGKPYIPNKVVVNANTAESAQLGVKSFAANCAMCHGLDGRKKYRNAADLTTSTMNPALLAPLINEGSKGKMPAFSGTLSDEEVNALTVYLLSLRGK
jgi:cytochrome c oxidase cbb3-type subunit 3